MIFPHLAIRAARDDDSGGWEHRNFGGTGSILFFTRDSTLSKILFPFSRSLSRSSFPSLCKEIRTKGLAIHLRFFFSLPATVKVAERIGSVICERRSKGNTKRNFEVRSTFETEELVTTFVIGSRDGSNFPIGPGMIGDYKDGRKTFVQSSWRSFAKKNSRKKERCHEWKERLAWW